MPGNSAGRQWRNIAICGSEAKAREKEGGEDLRESSPGSAGFSYGLEKWEKLSQAMKSRCLADDGAAGDGPITISASSHLSAVQRIIACFVGPEGCSVQ